MKGLYFHHLNDKFLFFSCYSSTGCIMTTNGFPSSYEHGNKTHLRSTLLNYLRLLSEGIITPNEAKLLDLVSSRYDRVPWASITGDQAMRHNRQTVPAARASSAGAKLRTHPSFETGFLVDDPDTVNRFRPTTGSTARSANHMRAKMRVVGAPRVSLRAQTSAAVPDRRRHHRVEQTSPSQKSRSRRLTLIGCEKRADIELAFRRYQLGSINRKDRLKRTVRTKVQRLLICLLVGLMVNLTSVSTQHYMVIKMIGHSSKSTTSHERTRCLKPYAGRRTEHNRCSAA
jgi:hypothetical protein